MLKNFRLNIFLDWAFGKFKFVIVGFLLHYLLVQNDVVIAYVFNMGILFTEKLSLNSDTLTSCYMYLAMFIFVINFVMWEIMKRVDDYYTPELLLLEYLRLCISALYFINPELRFLQYGIAHDIVFYSEIMLIIAIMVKDGFNYLHCSNTFSFKYFDPRKRVYRDFQKQKRRERRKEALRWIFTLKQYS